MATKIMVWRKIDPYFKIKSRQIKFSFSGKKFDNGYLATI